MTVRPACCIWSAVTSFKTVQSLPSSIVSSKSFLFREPLNLYSFHAPFIHLLLFTFHLKFVLMSYYWNVLMDGVPPQWTCHQMEIVFVLFMCLLFKLLLSSNLLAFFVVYEVAFFNICITLLYSYAGFNFVYIIVLYLLGLSSIELIIFLSLLLM